MYSFYSKYPIADALAMYMQNEPSQVIDKLLYALFRDGSQSDSVLLIRSNHLATLVPGLMQQFLRDYEIDTNTIARQQQLLKSVAQNSTYVNSYLLDKYNNEGITPLYAWLASTTSDSTQMLSDSLSDNIINTALQYYGDAVASQQADQQQIDKSQAGIYAFANWWQGASDYITTISPELLGSISYDSDPELAVNNYLNSSNGDINKLHEAVAASSDGSPNLQRIASLLQVNLSPANITSPYVDVLKTQQMRLAEQPIYGSSRVGVASYWPGQYDAVWDYTTGTQDTLRLLGIKPWYSATLEGYKPAGSTEPYDNSSLGLASAAHLLGQKSYELSNHLGNVQATLSDKRYVQKQYYTASDSLRKGFAASVSSLYDYYPFGMLMQERCTSDTATQSVYASQVVYSPQYTTVNNAMTGASITTTGTTAQSNYNGSISYTGTTAGIKKVLSNLIPNVPVSIKIKVLYNYKPLYIAVGEASAATPNSYTNLLYSTMSNGSINFTFTPTQTNVELSIKEAALTPSIFATSHLCFTIDSVNYTQQNGSTSSTQLVQISSKQSDKYRFGYGGHEKMNEISGVGNTIDMGDRWLDTRIGRTPKTDLHKIKYPNLSSYSYAANNPIFFIDPDGKDIVHFDNKGKEVHRETSNRVFKTMVQKQGGNFVEAPMPGVIKGYESSKFQKLDYQIAASTFIFNEKLETKTGLPATANHQVTGATETPVIDVNLVKAMVMQESTIGQPGGNGTGDTDPMQANYPGDFNASKDVKSAVGLSKNQEMTPAISINAGLGILFLKGMKSNEKGDYTIWRGDKAAVGKYNGGGTPGYADKVMEYKDSMTPAKTENYVEQKKK